MSDAVATGLLLALIAAVACFESMRSHRRWMGLVKDWDRMHAEVRDKWLDEIAAHWDTKGELCRVEGNHDLAATCERNAEYFRNYPMRGTPHAR